MKILKHNDLDFEFYSKLFKAKIPLAHEVNKHTWAGRCILCNDSKKNPKKTRLYLLRERKGLPHVVTCHNCHFTRSAKLFFEENYAEEMQEINRIWKERRLSDIKDLEVEEEKIKEPTEDEQLISFEKELVLAKDVLGKFFDTYTNPMATDSDAYRYMKERYIDNRILNHCRLLKPEFQDRRLFRYAYLKDYILIPFIDIEDGKYYFFHARKYCKLDSDSMARYLSCPYSPNDINVDFYYNEKFVTKEDPVIICEGTISSMNLPNAISTNGIGKQTEDFVKKMEWKFGGVSNIIYANDNELVDENSMEKTKELLSKNKRVFLWSLFVKDFPKAAKMKDFNDICVSAKKTMIPLSIIQKYSVDSLVSLYRIKTNVY